MNSLRLWKVAVCAGLLALSAGVASAQAPGLRADVPFAFTAADQLLPAGEYRYSLDTTQTFVRIVEEYGNKIWLVRLVAGDPDRRQSNIDKGLLRFTRAGDRYYLNALWLSGSAQGKSMMPSRIPRELGKVTLRDVQATK